jgi:hypothetical protein
MSVSYSIYDWLQTAFTEPVNRINESYFFDKRDHQFYSVFITDYFLIDPHEQNDYPDSPYSTEELALLSERINRQENNVPSILDLPRLTIEERKELMQKFLDQYLPYLRESLQSLVNSEDGRTSLDFNNLLPKGTEEEWQEFKRNFIQRKIDSFCNLHSINLETATLWKDNKMTTISLNISEPEKITQEQRGKPWGHFWKS